MLDRLSNEQLGKITLYERVLVYLFRKLTAGITKSSFPNVLPFDLDDIRDAVHRAHRDQLIPRIIKNIPDIKYTFDARRHMPSEVEQCGPITWLQVSKGSYKLQRTVRRNLLDLDTALMPSPTIEQIADQTPKFVTQLLGQDEQATFTRVRNAGLINQVLGFQAWPIQGHHRTTVSYGQIEIDEVQAGLQGNKGCIVPISGKGGRDQLSWSQVLNLNTYGAEKPRVPNLAVRSIGLWKDAAGSVWIVEFSPETDIDKIAIKQVRRFEFV
ncbi:MAG TPA: hypothetical protein VG841_02425 [Caulobacterales bacterium]|nr:hypothetical protein [Caulobacterales bacterium]